VPAVVRAKLNDGGDVGAADRDTRRCVPRLVSGDGRQILVVVVSHARSQPAPGPDLYRCLPESASSYSLPVSDVAGTAPSDGMLYPP
jgi:hypothetical protein